MLKCHVILSYIISSNRKHTRCCTLSHDYSVTCLQFDQSDSFTLVRFNQWRSSIVMWFGHSWYSIYTVRSVHFRMLLISHNYSFSFSELIKDNVSRHDTLIGDESGINSNICDLIQLWHFLELKYFGSSDSNQMTRLNQLLFELHQFSNALTISSLKIE